MIVFFFVLDLNFNIRNIGINIEGIWNRISIGKDI